MLIGSYVSRLLKEHLLQSESSRRARRREFDGVLLHTDIAEFTLLTERFSQEGPGGAERLSGILNRYFGDVFGTIENYGGDIIRIEGDAVLALWRYEEGRAPPVDLAASAALALQQRFHNWRPELGVPLSSRLSLGAGRLSAIDVCNPEGRSFFLLIGEPLDAVASASHAGKPNEIIVTDRIAGALERLGHLQPGTGGFLRLVGLRSDLGPDTARVAPRVVDDRADALVRRFIPSVLVQHADAGHFDWLAEFRTLSVGCFHFPGLPLNGAGALKRIDATFDAIHDAITPLGVDVLDLMVGDKGFLALVGSGLPLHSQDNNAARTLEAVRGAYAALAAIGIDCSIGVATGRAFCGDVGSATRREYLVLGPVMNYAARLMQAANRGVRFDDATARAVSGYFELAEAEMISVKGCSEPIRMYRLEATMRARRPALRREGMLHGREAQVRQLLQCLKGDAQEEGVIAAIEAEAGAGKSALLAHIRSAARAREHGTLWAATSPIESTTAYYAWRAIIGQLLLQPGDPERADRALLRRRLDDAVAGGAVADKITLLEDIMPLGFHDQALASRIRGSARLSGLEDLVVHLVGRFTAGRRTVLLVDDLHWLDDPSARLLLAVARRVPRIGLIVAGRPLQTDAGPHIRRLRKAVSLRIPLHRLGRDSIERIVCDVLGVHAIPGRLCDFVQAQSEGLPFHAEQLALSLRDQGLLEVFEGKCRILASNLSSGVVADGLRDVIVGRIDKLEAPQRLAAKVASVIGRRFDLETLRHIHPIASEATRLEGVLADLVRGGILAPEAGSEGAAYAFAHVIIREVTHDSLTYEKREALHRRVATFIEQRHRENLEPYFAQLADHFEQGAEGARAVEYRELAAAAALRRYANHDSLSHVEKIDELVARFRLSPPQPQRARLALIRGDACHELSRFAEAERHFLQCAALSRITVPVTRSGFALRVPVEVARQIWHRCAGPRRASAAQVRERDRLAAHIFTRLAEQAYFAGDALAVMYGTLASLNCAERVGSIHEVVEGYGALAIGMGTAGLHRLAEFYRKRSIACATRDGGLQDQGIAHLFAAVYAFQAGKWQTALEHCRHGAGICERLGDRFRQQSCQVVHAYTELLRGNFVQAETIFESFGEDAQDVENGPVRAWILVGRGIIDMMLGRPPGRTIARVGLAREEYLHRAERLLCDGLEALARLQTGDLEQALSAAKTALGNMVESVPTVGIALISVSATAEVFLAAAEAGKGQSREALALARSACKAVRAYAAKTAICRPRAMLLRGRLALLRGHSRQARRCGLRALREAERLDMPLERALCHLALARVEADERSRSELRCGLDILERIGARPWLCDTGGAVAGERSAALGAAAAR